MAAKRPSHDIECSTTTKRGRSSVASSSLWEGSLYDGEQNSDLDSCKVFEGPLTEAPWEVRSMEHLDCEQEAPSSRILCPRGAAELPLIQAAARGKLKEVQALLAADELDLLDTDKEGDNALLAAITEAKYADSVLLIQCLLQHDPLLATAVRADDYQYSPLISLVAGAAVRGQHADTERACQIGELLLSHGADPLHRDAEGGWTFLHWSVDMTNGKMEKTARRVRDRILALLQRLFLHEGLRARAAELVLSADDKNRDAMDFILINQDDDMAPVLAFMWKTIGVRRAIQWLEAVPSPPMPLGKRRQSRMEYLRDSRRTNAGHGAREAAMPNCWAVAQDFLSTEGSAWIPLRK